MTPTALIIDDEADIRELIAMSLDRIGFDTHTAANLAEARNLLDTYAFDVCLTDMKLPDGNGVTFVPQIHERQPELPVAVITAHGNMDAAVEAMKNGAFDFVSKPVDIGLLRKLVTQAVTLRHSNRSPREMGQDQNHDHDHDHDHDQDQDQDQGRGRGHAHDSAQMYRDEPTLLSPVAVEDCNPGGDSTVTPVRPGSSESTLERLGHRCSAATPRDSLSGGERLIGRSEPMQRLRTMIAKVARTNAPVWITGESGTGKELIARLVHENSPRTNAPFVAINCGAIPGELMESELFGHRKGSFTGANSDHDGLFRRAEGGTLFLDEVAELPLHMQVKLLRAIQERSVRPVGASEEIAVDVRILSASHKDLAEAVEQGSFRHDLYYRLNVICIQSPCLRERGNDVIDIARHILSSLSRNTTQAAAACLTATAEQQLCDYAFPGNVRELENVLERAVALSDNGMIDADDLNLKQGVSAVSQPLHDRAANLSGKPFDNQDRERELILQMLEQTRWNRKAAALKLGLTYRQLRYRIQQYGIDTDETGS